MKKETLVFLSLFFERLKPHSTSILDTAIDITDAAVAAFTQLEVRSAEYTESLEASNVSTR